MYTDPISDMLTRMRNALATNRSEVVLPNSKLKESLAKLLYAEGFVSGVNVLKGKQDQLQINLKYINGQSVIVGLKRVSKPGQRIYLPVDKLPRTNGGFGLTVVSTSKGLMTDAQARKMRAGGEVICQVW